MPTRTVEQRTHGTAEPRLDALPAAAIEQLRAAAHAIRDGFDRAATKALDTALALAPAHPELLRMYAIVHARAQRFDHATAALQQTIKHWPDYALAFSDLGNVQQSSGDMEAAFASWRQACELAPHAPMPWFNLGRNRQLHGDTAAAIDALGHAVELAPDFLPAQILRGDALAHAGRFDDADLHYRAALALQPTCGDAWRGLANMKTRPLSASDTRQLAAALQHAALPPADRIAMGFALGKGCEDQGHYEAAFAAIERANAEMHRVHPWSADDFHAYANAMQVASAHLPPPLDPQLGHEVIFIVGLPRSGSTLFEQILAAHPEVEGASELTELEQTLAEESRRRGQMLLQWIGAVDANDWQRLGRRYLQLTARWRTDKPRHTDKLPSNWLFSGVLAAMLPGARIIEVRRDAMEAGWSCYKQQFYRLPHFACTLSDIAAYIRDAEQAMDAWQATSPQRIRIQHYEALLDAPEQEIRALLAFCNLPFNAACLDYQRAARHVRTASAAQVRQPLQRDTARAGRYGALLDPLRTGLGLPDRAA